MRPHFFSSKLDQMPNSPIYSYSFTIPQSVIDENGHVNNVAYLQWMQDAGFRVQEAIIVAGYKPPENTTWYAREHRIEYLLPAFLGEEIKVSTWLSEIKRVRAHRRYEFLRISDGKVVVKGETDWVFVDAKTGRPVAIPDAISEFLSVLPDSTQT